MARITWDSDLQRLETRLRAMEKGLEADSVRIVDKAINRGADLMRQYIQTRGTGFEDRPGRVDEGYMLGDVAASEVIKDRKGVRGKFGWGVTGSPAQDYYVYQENGFRHWRSGKDVPPMHALLDAFIKTREEFYGDVLRMVNKNGRR